MAEAQREREEWFGMKLKQYTKENYRTWRLDLISCAVGKHSRVTLGLYILFAVLGTKPKPGRAWQAPTTHLHPPTLIGILKIYFMYVSVLPACMFVYYVLPTCMPGAFLRYKELVGSPRTGILR